MIEVGHYPYRECSAKGDERFSSVCAVVKGRGKRTIEEIYQAAKVFGDGSTDLNVKQAVGKGLPVNQKELIELHQALWSEYLAENPFLIDVLLESAGLSDERDYLDDPPPCHVLKLWDIRRTFEIVEVYSVAVVGSRDYPNLGDVHEWVRQFNEYWLSTGDTRGLRLVSGGARGPDKAGEDAAREHRWLTLIYEAEWDKYGKSAGHMRNPYIVDAADEVVAFWDEKSRGTIGTIEYAGNAGKPLTVVMPSEVLQYNQ